MWSQKKSVIPESKYGLSRRLALRAVACAAAFGMARSPVFGQGKAELSLDHQSDATFVSSRDRLRGINTQQPFAHWEKGVPWNKRGWDSWLPRDRLATIAATGIDFLRICVDPAPLLATRTEADLDSGIETVLQSIDTVLQAGMKAIFDVHVSADHPIWNTHTLTDGTRGRNFLRLLEVEISIARTLQSRYSPHSVAFELFNEPPPLADFYLKTVWAEQLRCLYDAVRSVAPKHTLIVSGTNYASIDGLVSIDATPFDTNTIFVFHYYEPFLFTFQGINQYYFKYVHRLTFPPKSDERSGVVERATALANGDDGISVFRKPALIAELSKSVDQYFGVPQDVAYIRGRVDEVAAWADKNQIGRNRIMCGEFGCFGDVAGSSGAALTDRATWLQTVRQAVEESGFNWCVHDLDESFRITNDNGKFVPELLAALGLRTS